jgi:hypothetical protein
MAGAEAVFRSFLVLLPYGPLLIISKKTSSLLRDEQRMKKAQIFWAFFSLHD